MSPSVRRQVRQGFDVVERSSARYCREFASLMRKLNADPTPQTGRRLLRLCVEAVNMHLDTQKQLAVALRSMSDI
jgi:hypothetical protein